MRIEAKSADAALAAARWRPGTLGRGRAHSASGSNVCGVGPLLVITEGVPMPTDNEIEAQVLQYIMDRDSALNARATKRGAIAALAEDGAPPDRVLAAIVRLHAAGTVTQMSDDELAWRPPTP